MFTQPPAAYDHEPRVRPACPGARWIGLVLLLLVLVPGASGDGFPPDWDDGAGSAVHFQPVSWPADDGDGVLDDGDWVPYTLASAGILDNRVQDPTNGGTSPQNYVNLASGCGDLVLPSVYLYYDSANQVLMFRWRVEQIGHTYATGPSPGVASAVDPWKSALWTVLIDIDGDGFREYAVQVDGSSGTPGEEIDRMVVSYSDSPDQSVDYVERTDICEVSHNPTAFTASAADDPTNTGFLMNFHNSLSPDAFWVNGANESVWDYGTTRARRLECTGPGESDQYFVDYQISLAALDAASSSDPDCPSDAPAVDELTPLCVLFTTSNSLQNPLQKDVVLNDPGPGNYCTLEPEDPAPFGDCFAAGDFTPGSDFGQVEQPIVQGVTSVGCGPTTLTASVTDATQPASCAAGALDSTVADADFFYYDDTDGNGLADDGNSWIDAGTTETEAAPGEWTASWDTTALRQGSYLIGVRTEDTGEADSTSPPAPPPVFGPPVHVTFSYLTQAEVDALTPPAGEEFFPNPSTPGLLVSNFNNFCGTYPSVTKVGQDVDSGQPSPPGTVVDTSVGRDVEFTVTVTAADDQSMTLTSIDDFLPSGWTYNNSLGATLTPDSEPAIGASGTISWPFTSTTLAAGASGTLAFRATAPADQGSFTNRAQVHSNEPDIDSNLVQIGVGEPILTIAKRPDVLSQTPGSPVTYTIIYGNDSPVTVTNAVITDVLPTGLTFVSAADGGTYDAATRTITWSIGTLFAGLPAGASGRTVSFTANVDSPFAGSNPLINTATIDSDETSPLDADASVFISLPLVVQKATNPSSPTVAQGGTVTFQIDFANTGATNVRDAQLVDTLPAGFSYVGGSTVLNGGAFADPAVSGGGLILTWANVNGALDVPPPPGPVSAGNSGVLTFQATAAGPPFTDPNPATNTVEFSANDLLLAPLSPVSDTYDVGVIGLSCVATTFYLHASPQDVGGGAGFQKTADTTAPTGTPTTFSSPVTQSRQDFLFFYQDPSPTEAVRLDGTTNPATSNTTVDYWSKKTRGNPAVHVTLYDYDPTSDPAPVVGDPSANPLPGTQIIHGTGSAGGSMSESSISWDSAWTHDLPAGHRLLWAFGVSGSNSSQIDINVDGTAANDGDSRSGTCLLTIAFETAINVTVDKLSAVPGNTLLYTIDFSNISAATVNAATIADLLPVGVTYDPTFIPTLNGVPLAGPRLPTVSGTSTTGQTVTFPQVEGGASAAGAINSGDSGVLIFRATIDNAPVTATSSTLVDSATLSTTEAPDVSDTASTNLTRPNLVVTKDADKTLLVPIAGSDTVTYTVTMTNSGDTAAANPLMSDTLPAQPQFAYIALSCAWDLSLAPTTTPGSAVCNEAGLPVLTFTVDTLAPGETIEVTFSLQAQNPPLPPSNITTYDNFATVTNTTEPTTTATSNTVTVTISLNPNLEITLSEDKSVVDGNEVITYTITVENVGFGAAEDVVVTNPIPALTGYNSGTMTYEGAGQTDADDSPTDEAFYNAITNALVWNVTDADGAPLPSGATRTLTFQVTTDPTFPAGATTIVDTATVSASNAASKEDSVSATVPAPALTVWKSAPTTLIRELTELSGNHSDTTTVNVDDASLLSVGQYVEINGTGTEITAIAGNVLTVSVAISGTNNNLVNSVVPYTILYNNTSDTGATNVVITDTLDAGTTFITASPTPTVQGGPTAVWSLGNLAAGTGGSVKVWASPSSSGTFVNNVTLSSHDTSDVTDDATTVVGVLEPSKVALNPTPALTQVTNDGVATTREIAQYTLTVVNNTGAVATGVQVADTMEAGFTYCDNTVATPPNPACAATVLSRARDTATSLPTNGDAAPTWCCWDLAAGETLTITFDATIDGTVGAGIYNNDLDVTSTNTSALDFDPLGTATDEEVEVLFSGPNYVLIRGFDASATGDGVVLAWETDAEIGPVAFEVLRLDPQSGFLPVGDGAVPATLAPQGASYQLLDAEAPLVGPLAYLLFEVLGDGSRQAHGPFLVDPQSAAAGPGGARLRDGFAATPRRAAAERAKPSAPGLVGADRGPGTGLRIGVREEGLYRVSAAAIDEALGFRSGEASSMIRSGKLLLLNDDVEVAWAAEGGGHATALLFYGQGIRSRYSNERVYRLLPIRGERMKNASGGVRGALTAQATFTDTVRFEEDVRPALLGTYTDDTEFWLWDFYLAGHPVFGRHTHTFGATGAVAAGADAELTVAVLGTSLSLGGSHHVEAHVNGVAVGDGQFTDYQSAAFTFTFPASLLAAGANTLELVGRLDPGVTLSVFALDHFELTYERDFVATTPAFAFGSEAHEQLVVDGFADAEILLLDVTDPSDPREVQGAKIEPGTAGAYQVRFSPDAADGRYLATVAAGVREPSSIEVDHPSNLHDGSNWADYLVITAGELYTTAEDLASHREGQGLASMVVDVDDVMDEWNGGQLDPEAIRTFLTYTTTHWQQAPRYVALVGEGTVDYKGVWGLRANLLPPLLVAAPWGFFASDNRLADVDDDGLPDFAVGRIPASTAAELAGVIAKIVDYETMPDAAWMNDVVLVADDPDATGDYTLASDLLAASLPATAVAHRIYLEHQSPASAKADLRGRIESGTSLVSFLGHAGVTILTHERILKSADVPGFTNGGRLGVVSALTCNLGNFALPNFPSLAEDLVLHPDGGAAAVWTAVGLSYNPRRIVVGEAFLRSISQGGTEVLGDAVLDALRAAASHPRVGRQTLESQVLIGDPALRLRIAPNP